jgi:acetolactate synthase small subunit
MADVTHTLTLLVRDAPGVLLHVAEVFARRNCNINSVHVLPHEGEWSNMIITIHNGEGIEQIAQELDTLPEVKHVFFQDDFAEK